MVFWIDELDWDESNEDHIARHGVDIVEVEELVFDAPYFVRRVGQARYQLIGRTAAGRMLTVFVDRQYSIFPVATARDATSDERRIDLRHINGRRSSS